MPRPRPPSRVDTIRVPVFGLSWYGNPGDGTSIVVLCGGGGSARTGVKNCILVQNRGKTDGSGDLDLSTGDQVAVSVLVYESPISHKLGLVAAVGRQVVRYSLPGGLVTGRVNVADEGDSCSAVTVNAMADWLAVGCDSGVIKVFHMNDDEFCGQQSGIDVVGHEKAVCALTFSTRGNRLVSSAKDGTARVWNVGKDNVQLLAVLKCSIQEINPSASTKRSAAASQVLVRGCALGDLEGKTVYTVASGRRGKAFLSKWVQNNAISDHVEFSCQNRTECSEVPVSAMSLSGDANLLVLGGVDGTVTMWKMDLWKAFHIFKEVHDLPVTCIAARPFPLPLQGEDNGVQMQAISASADSQLAWLTTQRRVPRQPRQASPSKGKNRSAVGSLLCTVWWVVVLVGIGYPVIVDTMEKCSEELSHKEWGLLQRCIIDEVLIAPESKPGISIPPH